ncbi:hypothetical protein K5I29_12605 [Flavobacterium agricola]|uniref:tRNA (Guanine-N1)-methyltransferase n=1 Tax=Flavobacterium agricola TaxID=2870839 RepID=A0ABY6LY96_9FLAO|nr:hypothetical protein [Flavobacterium agricola]UYW01271.1 hypothetical protein K5I29_12605 [Flavobacterium agricola]
MYFYILVNSSLTLQNIKIMFAKFISFLSPVLFFVVQVSHATTIDSTSNPKSNTRTFEALFKKVEDESNSYQDYKLFKKSDVRMLENAYKTDEANFEKTITDLQAKVNAVQAANTELSASNKELAEKVADLTAEIEKSLTKIYLIVIAVLVVALAYFIYRYKALTDNAKEHKTNIEEIEVEFEEYKRSAIEREQKLRREMINMKNSPNKHNSSKSNKDTSEAKIDLDELLAKKADENNKKSK